MIDSRIAISEILPRLTMSIKPSDGDDYQHQKIFIIKDIMKAIFSISALLALASSFVSAAPLIARQTITLSASELFVVTNPNPANILADGTPNGQVSIVDGSNEIDTIVSFSLGNNPNPTTSSTCQFAINGITPPTGSGIVQLFTLGAEVSVPLTSVPFEDQYMGQYDVTTGDSVPIDVQFVPCNFNPDGTLQFIIRPQNTDDYLAWVQTSTVGAFLEYTP